MRNDHIHISATIYPRSVRYKTLNAIFEQNLTTLIAVSGSPSDLPPNIWLPPPTHWVKLNFYGSFDPLTTRAGIGGILGNATGLLIRAYAGMVQAAHSIKAELQALISGVDICLKTGHRNIIFEGDCLISVDSILKCKGLPYTFMHNWRILFQKLKQLNS